MPVDKELCTYFQTTIRSVFIKYLGFCFVSLTEHCSCLQRERDTDKMYPHGGYSSVVKIDNKQMTTQIYKGKLGSVNV